MQFDDIRKAIEATLGNLTPARAQQLAKSYLEPGAAKEQVAKTAADMLEWSARSRGKLRMFVRGEIRDQLKVTGVATQSEVDALKKRVRQLEREVAKRPAQRGKTAASKTAAAKRAGRASSTS
jgi:polyhydroxyalkanoate synthesis regulator phasin